MDTAADIQQLRIRTNVLIMHELDDRAYKMNVVEIIQTFNDIDDVIANDELPSHFNPLLNFLAALGIKYRRAFTLEGEERRARLMHLLADLDQHSRIYEMADTRKSLALLASNVITLSELVFEMKTKIMELEEQVVPASDPVLTPIESWPALPVKDPTNNIKEESKKIWEKVAVNLVPTN